MYSLVVFFLVEKWSLNDGKRPWLSIVDINLAKLVPPTLYV